MPPDKDSKDSKDNKDKGGLPPGALLGAAGAIFGGALSLFKAKRVQKQLALQNRLFQQRSIAEQKQSKFRTGLELTNISRGVRRAIGEAATGLGERLGAAFGRSGGEALAFGIAAPAAQDTEVIRQEQQSRDEAFQQERQDFAATTRAQSPNLLMSMAEGVLGGASAGLGFEQQLGAMRSDKENLDWLKERNQGQRASFDHLTEIWDSQRRIAQLQHRAASGEAEYWKRKVALFGGSP